MVVTLAERPVETRRAPRPADPRIAELDALIAELKGAPNDGSRAEFAAVFDKARRTLEASDLELSILFQVSRPTIGRWARGEAAPHRLGRRPLFDDLIKLARKRQKLIRR
jgi:hypothetical protein